ncbi:MAG: recN [Bacillota bacterium]|nr:recN [Bacillota bacterium]
MLLNLNISNFAVFEKESITFDSGFNVFTGETGSGKSILIEALLIILGERASKDLIRKGKKSALIEAIFDISHNIKLNEFLMSNNISIDEGDFLIVTREILESGKSINKINSRTVPLNILKEIGSYLIDVYGQFGHESLFKKENHIKLLDSLVLKELGPLLDEYLNLYKDYSKKCIEIDYFEKKLINKDSKIEQLSYELSEIDDSNLEESEEEKLLKELKKLSFVQDEKNSLNEINNIISHNSNSVINNLNSAYSLLNKIKSYDENINQFLSKLELLLEEMQDFVYETIDYSDNLDINEEQLNLVEKRVSLINRLKRKYGFSIEKILEYRDSICNELQILKQAESNLLILKKEQKQLFNKISVLADNISVTRKKAAHYLQNEILIELNDLNMKNILFQVNITKKSDFSPDGLDSVEFLIATNAGSDLNSVQKVVSGGEASRIMLAFKKLCSDIDLIDSLVFDEIDTGISGKTAQMAGIKMKYISLNHQVICVTHSPQIASISKHHFYIEKNVVENNTYSTVKKLSDDNKIHEIARLLSGMKITEKSLSNAKELIDISNNINNI